MGVSEQNKDVSHKQKGQVQEENKRQKIQTSEAGKKSKAQQLREKAEIISINSEICGQTKPIYKALFKNRYWILIAKVEHMFTSPSFFLIQKAKAMRLGFTTKFHT